MKKAFLTTCLIFSLSSISAWTQESSKMPYGESLAHHVQENFPEDITAVASAQIGAIKKGLQLNTDQEKLWSPVEIALKTISFHRKEAMQKKAKKTVPKDFMEHMQHTAIFLTEKAKDFSLLASSLEPFSSALDEGQKRRLCLFVNPFLGRSDWKCLQHKKEKQALKIKTQEKSEENKKTAAAKN